MNAKTFNRLHPVGTRVFAYPGARPEDVPDTRRLVTRTRSKAEVLGGHTDVVWVYGYSSCIALDHVDVVSEAEWEAAVATGGATESFASLDDRGVPEPSETEEKRARLFGFIEAGASEGDFPSFAAALDEYVGAVLAEAISRVEDPEERAKTPIGLGLGWESAREVLRRMRAEVMS
ncbi:hypothetical protein [Streptomyces sp. NPDC088794]|uniref:hypothetical protein n=1 Tax=Streptomyces sp. NPDC088794 TaxID=3365902 RepID=UPI003826EF96